MTLLAAATPPAGQPGGTMFLILVAVITAVGGGTGLTAIFLVGSQRRKARAEGGKADADGAQAISNAAVGLIKPLEERIERAETETRQIRTRLNRADKRIEVQAEEIVGLRAESRSLRALVRRIADIAKGTDAPATVLALRELLADNTHHTAE